ncbi:MAG: single-stranded-DNA-specific exonuclease RecJ [Clostridia bacterium]|nr:single-stranded-DNA-specific exonuclease RecJ [Clostridia bacterium]
MKKKWEYISPDKELTEKISNEFGISKLISGILVSRGIVDSDKIKIFLNPTRNDFYNPFLLNDMDIAVDKILEVVNKKGKMLIYGDYDVDGITSIAVLKKFLAELGLEVDYHIPNRLSEGYGLKKETLEEIAVKNYDLMVTVDCGISAVEEVEYANSLGINTIITDHHEPVEKLPPAIAVINPKRKDSTYPFRGLAGVGVVFKLIQAISIKLELEEKEYLKYLDLVCVGTISDIVPLIDENRVITKLGLKLVEVTKNVGLRELIKVSRYKKIDSSAVSFGVAPRINACGRMGHAEEALKLFLTPNIVEAQEITKKLEEYNLERQNIEKRIFKEVQEKLNDKSEANRNSIVLASDTWHHGVIGIVASKLIEQYYKPTLLFATEDGVLKGSGRSITGFDLHEALCKCGDYLLKYGGHAMAVGLTLEEKYFVTFKEKFERIVEESNISEAVPILNLDGQLTGKEIKKELANEMQILEPFGEANKMPVILFKNLKIDSIRALSEGKHLKLSLKCENQWIDAIGFNLGHLADEYQLGDNVDIAGSLEINNFNGNEFVQINIKDIMKTY